MKRTVMYIKEDVALEFAEEMTDDFPSSELFILLCKLYRMIEYIEISNMHGIAYSIVQNINPMILMDNKNPSVAI